MNYIKEINAFYDVMEREPLSASAVNLWHTLLHINNKAAWIEEFTVPATVLKLKGGLTDSSFKRARKELEERGFIEWRSNGRNLSPFYKMIRLYKRGSIFLEDNMYSVEKDLDQEVEPSVDQQTDHKMNQQVDQQTDQQTAPLIKQKEIKQNETKPNKGVDATDAIVFYRENFGMISPFLAEELLSWINDFGDAFVMEAMKRSLERGKLSFGYVKGILNSWVKQGIDSVEVLKVREEERKNQRSSGYGSNRNGARNVEIVPEWFLDRKRKPQPQQVNVNDDMDAGALLKAYLATRVM